MGIPGWGQILLVVLLIVLLFGRGKISDLMGDVAKGIRSFKDGLKEEPEDVDAPAAPEILENAASKAEAPAQKQAEKTS